MTAGIVTQMSPVTDFKVPTINTNTDKSADFSEVFKASTGKNGEQQNETIKASESKSETTEKKTVGDGNAKTEKVTDSEKNVSKANSDKKEVVKEDKDITEEVEAAVQTLLAEVAETLGVSIEDVTGALEELDMTAMDLLDESIIPQLVANIEGDGNAVEIMTDENLFADVKDLTAKVEEAVTMISQETGASAEEIKDFAKEIGKSSAENAQSAEEMTQLVDEESQEVNVSALQDTKQQRNTKGDGNNGTEAQTNPAQTIVENIKAVAAGKSEEVMPVQTADMNRIYDQVRESVRVNMNEEVTEMEMNLHPASLGNVKVQVASRDGVVTANFITQNETVKAALESQIIQLQEDMNEQGIKVESIEVTLASHAFEENLSENNEGSATEEGTRKKRRSINLNEIDDDADIIVEDDVRIAREMMMHNGTTVDYLA